MCLCSCTGLGQGVVERARDEYFKVAGDRCAFSQIQGDDRRNFDRSQVSFVSSY